MINAVTHILKNDTQVQEIVGDNEASTKYKVYPSVAPASEKPPYIAVRLTAKEQADKSMKNFNCAFDVYCFTPSYDTSESLGDEVIRALNGTAQQSYNGENVAYINYFTSRDEHDMSTGQLLYARIVTFQGSYSKSLT